MDREILVGRIYKHYTGKYYIITGIENNLVTYEDMDSRDKISESLLDFANAKVPENAESTQKYQFEPADEIVEIGSDKLKAALLKTEGYCPCNVKRNPDTKCMCKEFRESMKDGECHCGLYEKHWLGDQM